MRPTGWPAALADARVCQPAPISFRESGHLTGAQRRAESESIGPIALGVSQQSARLEADRECVFATECVRPAAARHTKSGRAGRRTPHQVGPSRPDGRDGSRGGAGARGGQARRSRFRSSRRCDQADSEAPEAPASLARDGCRCSATPATSRKRSDWRGCLLMCIMCASHRLPAESELPAPDYLIARACCSCAAAAGSPLFVETKWKQ
jgi:hypothetical protein